ncbi:MAG: SDR family NAD(P)-dependent oxidoreductase [Firmicutes bacterium]|nr:SDR family NAD(P)-dependent oxidoreductase [Bacillota bacterium]
MKKKNVKYLSKFVRLDGKTAVITGASGAIGKQIAAGFLVLGANVVLPSITMEEGNGAKAELVSLGYDESKISIYQIDLGSNDSVDAFVDAVKDKSINYLINNAGVISNKWAYPVNFTGTVYLTAKLTPLLNKNPNSTVVFQSSLSYQFGKVDWSDVRGDNLIKPIKTYSRSKRLLNLAVVAMKEGFLKNYPNVQYAIAHPGCVPSDIMGKKSKLSHAIGKRLFHTAETAALSAILAAIKPVPDDKLVGPRCLGVWGRPKFKNLHKALFIESEQEQIKKVLEDILP